MSSDLCKSDHCERVTVISEKITDEKKSEVMKTLKEYYQEEEGFTLEESEKIRTTYVFFKMVKFFKDNSHYFKSFKLCERCLVILPYGVGKNNSDWYLLKINDVVHNDIDLCGSCYESHEMASYRRNYVLNSPKLDSEAGLLH
jgi:hypothetical protein